MQVRSVSFDTSFLLKDDPLVDIVVKKLARDSVACFVTSTVVSELEQLKIWGRISKEVYKCAIKRLKRTHATVIDFKNRFFSSAFGKECIISMEKHHGVKANDIANDCSILVSVLKNGVNFFLSEDYHFTSEITKEVIDEVKNAACSEYHQMCDSMMYSVDSKTFLQTYKNGNIDLDFIQSKMKPIRKKGKLFGKQDNI
jgi:hypothetical protein